MNIEINREKLFNQKVCTEHGRYECSMCIKKVNADWGHDMASPKEGWRNGTKTFIRQFMRCPAKNDGCDGCKADMEAIIRHIESLLSRSEEEARAREEKVREIIRARAGHLVIMGRLEGGEKEELQRIWDALSAPAEGRE